MMKEFCCPSCERKSFKIVPYQILKRREKLLMVICESCAKPLGLVQSMESAALMRQMSPVKINKN